MPEVREAIASPFGHGELRLAQRWRLARELADARYDQAVVLPNSFKSALVPRFAGITLRTGFVGELRQLLLNDARRLDEQSAAVDGGAFRARSPMPPATPLQRPLPAPRL